MLIHRSRWIRDRATVTKTAAAVMVTQAVVKFNANGSNQFEHQRQNDDVLTKMVAPPKNNLRTITLHKSGASKVSSSWGLKLK